MNARTTAADLVAAASTTITSLDPDALAQEVGSEDLLLVDVREADELEREGAIEGAVHAPRGMIEFYADPTSPHHRPELLGGQRLVLYCASGGRSALAARVLQDLGYPDVAHLEGGLNAWRAAGLPTSPLLDRGGRR